MVQDGDIVFQADIIDVSSGYSGEREDTLEPNVVLRFRIEWVTGWIALEILRNIIPATTPGCRGPRSATAGA